MAKTPEGVIQAYGMAELKKRGCLVRKIGYEGRRAAPDTLNFVPERRNRLGGWLRPFVLLIEYKADETIQPEEHQLREHERIRQHGGDVRVIGSKAQVDALVAELFPCD